MRHRWRNSNSNKLQKKRKKEEEEEEEAFRDDSVEKNGKKEKASRQDSEQIRVRI